MIATEDRQNSVWDKGNQLADDDMMCRIRGSDVNNDSMLNKLKELKETADEAEYEEEK